MEGVVVVTGGTGGVGRTVVRELARAGRTVLYTHRDGRPPLDLSAEPAAVRARVSGAPVDLTDPEGVQRLFDEAAARFGAVAGLVHLAGAFLAGRAVETGAGHWRHLWQANVDSAFLAARAALPHMLRLGRGRIVLVAARAALQPRAGLAAYGVAKGAVARLAAELAEETRGTGVTVNCLAPGAIDTEANRAARPGADRRLWVSPLAVARVILWLLSEEAAVVNGALLPLEGPEGALGPQREGEG
ncbi:MAG: SDR family NAD(P)-dependent oxidoreductase [Firmicutes bacterium]|nr:SDR family NAD(P)-dependent oxidoreductase [Bacillota bacterium]